VSEPAVQAPKLEALVGTTIAERYRVDKLLGVGGMGAVFQARHLLLKRDVAIKVLHPQLITNPDISKRFDREAQSAARLDHPNVIPVTEFGSTDDGMKYMVMQLLSGRELSELLTGPLDPLRAIDLEIQILRGLEHAHDNGVIHRDLKPENVFVTSDHEGEEVLKLVDFGIAKIVDEDVEEAGSQPLTRLGLVFGTPHYMSPEQATGSAIDQRTDIYSAGVLLYQMLAGKLPFDNDDPVALIRMQVTVDPPPLPDSIPVPLQRVVKMMMAKTRDQRYPDARSARKALQAVQVRMAADAGVVVKYSAHDTGVVDPRDIYPPGHEALTNNPAFAGQATRHPSDSAPWDPSEVSGSGPHTNAIAPTMPPIEPQPKAQMSLADALTSSHPSLQQSQSPLAAWLAVIPRKYLYAAGGVLGLLVLIAMWPSGNPDEPSTDAADNAETTTTDKPVAVADPGADSGPSEPGEQPSPTTAAGGPSEDILIAIDVALTSKNEDEALDLIRPARDKFPDDPQLMWREGKALAMKKAKSSRVTALERYGQALDQDPKLIDNPDFYGELYVLLRSSMLREQAIDLAVQKLGAGGHKFLLELVNVDDPNQMLDWVPRHRVLDVLNADPEPAKLVDNRLNLARDLWQASGAPKPCTEFTRALEQIATARDPYFVETLMQPKLAAPEPNAAVPEDIGQCEAAVAKLVSVRDLYTQAFPDEAAKFAEAAKPTSKKKKKR
jgi:serine/threonine protein kinase